MYPYPHNIIIDNDIPLGYGAVLGQPNALPDFVGFELKQHLHVEEIFTYAHRRPDE